MPVTNISARIALTGSGIPLRNFVDGRVRLGIQKNNALAEWNDTGAEMVSYRIAATAANGSAQVNLYNGTLDSPVGVQFAINGTKPGDGRNHEGFTTEFGNIPAFVIATGEGNVGTVEIGFAEAKLPQITLGPGAVLALFTPLDLIQGNADILVPVTIENSGDLVDFHLIGEPGL